MIEVNLSLVSGSINTSSKSLIFFRFSLWFVNYDVMNNYSLLLIKLLSSTTIIAVPVRPSMEFGIDDLTKADLKTEKS